MSSINYLTMDDVQSSIRAVRLNQIIDSDGLTPDQIFQQAVKEATGLIKDHLLRFQIDQEFEKTGENRSSSVLFYCKNIVIYILYDRIPDDDVPDKVIKNYNDTISALQEISKGKTTIDLPLALLDTNGDGEGDTKKTKFRYGSDPLRRF